MDKYRDRIIIDVGAHDHFTSLRAHKGYTVNEAGETEEYYYRNLMIAASITPWFQNNPGVTVFEVDSDLIPRNLQTSYLNLSKTIGRTGVTPYKDLEFRDVDMAESQRLQRAWTPQLHGRVA